MFPVMYSFLFDTSKTSHIFLLTYDQGTKSTFKSGKDSELKHGLLTIHFKSLFSIIMIIDYFLLQYLVTMKLKKYLYYQMCVDV